MENERLRETVTLILKTKRFKVEKQKLIDKSRYFAALLSANYLEYNQTEHIINYDISPILLKDFINWIHDGKLDTFDTLSPRNPELEKLDHIFALLELSILFAVENLEKDATDWLERRYTHVPQFGFRIWLLAQELNFNSLRDYFWDICLERFDELPSNSIYKLSRENFLKLIGSIHINSTEVYRLYIAYEWMNRNNDFTVSLDIIKTPKQAKILHSIISCENPDNINSEHFIHCWDGDNFFELASFRYPQDIIDRSTGQNMLVGMQITGKRFNLYLCGGEFGNCSYNFNTDVWRYSLISKKWCLQTVMPVERRDMIAVILKNKLLLIGGTGRDRKRQALQSVDIYNIHTGIWKAGAPIPWKFTSVPEYFIVNDNLIIHELNWFFIYYLDKDVWKREERDKILHISEIKTKSVMSILELKTMSCNIDVINPSQMVLRTVIENMKCNSNFYCVVVVRRSDLTKRPKVLNKNSSTTSVICISDTYCLTRKMTVRKVFEFRTKYRTLFKCVNCIDPHCKLQLCDIPIQNPHKFRSFLSSNSPRHFFHLNHPADLYTTNLDDIINLYKSNR